MLFIRGINRNYLQTNCQNRKHRCDSYESFQVFQAERIANQNGGNSSNHRTKYACEAYRKKKGCSDKEGANSRGPVRPSQAEKKWQHQPFCQVAGLTERAERAGVKETAQ